MVIKIQVENIMKRRIKEKLNNFDFSLPLIGKNCLPFLVIFSHIFNIINETLNVVQKHQDYIFLRSDKQNNVTMHNLC